MWPHPKTCVAHKQCGARGLTLIEVLVALALTALMAALGGRIAINTVQSTVSSERAAAALVHHDALSQSLERDFLQQLALPVVGSTNLRLSGAPHPELAFAVLAPMAGKGAELHVAQRPAVVKYYFQREADGAAIVREVEDQTNPARPIDRQILASPVNDWQVEVCVAGRWTQRFPAESSVPPRAQAVRIRVTWADESPPWQRTFMWDGQP